MRKTALDFVNDILQAGDSEVVATLGETEEAGQALSILNRAVNRLVNQLDWEHRYVITKLSTASGTTTTWNPTTYPALPWVMKLPLNVESVYKVYYNQKEVYYMAKTEFQFRHINKLGLKTTADPRWWTTWDDQYLVFDNFDSDTESQLSSSNSEILVVKFPGVDLSDDNDTPDLPDRFYSAILNKALQYYFTEIESNIAKGREYRSEYVVDLSYLKKWARRNKAFESYDSHFDFSKKWPGTTAYRPDIPLNDLGPN